jgi:erythritol transport system ATP-binding protein
MSAPPVLEARGVTKEFPGTTALDNVDFAIERGRVHALIGENGAGKSTLVNILGGVDQPTSGTLLMNGQPCHFRSVRDAAALGIGVIHQELQLFPDLSCVDNLFVGRERRDRWGLIDRASQREAAALALRRLGQTFDPAVRVGALPLGAQQLVEIARALVHDVKVLMMDEPTSALTTAETETLFKIIRDLASHGVSVVYISHRLEELLEVADDVTVLRDGTVAGQAPVRSIGVPWIVSRMTGREMTTGTRATAVADGPVLLTVKRLSLDPKPGRTPLRDVSLEVRAGEIVGIYGLMGAGRTELFESILGVHDDARGEIRIGGDAIHDLEIHGRVSAGLFMIPEDRKAAGLVTTMTAGQNMTLSSLSSLSPRGYLSPAAELSIVSRFRDTLRIKCPDVKAAVTTLSGGNQQKVMLARGLMTRPRVMLLDEPTRGVDVAAKAEIMGAMRELAAEGIAVVFATSELGEAMQGATRVVVMSDGRIAAEFDPGHVTEAQVASAASSRVRGDHASA